jgi:hypothetical protein
MKKALKPLASAMEIVCCSIFEQVGLKNSMETVSPQED